MLRVERIIGKNIKFICTNNGRTGICSDGKSKYASFNLDADCCIALSNAKIYKVSEIFAMTDSILGVVHNDFDIHLFNLSYLVGFGRDIRTIKDLYKFLFSYNIALSKFD